MPAPLILRLIGDNVSSLKAVEQQITANGKLGASTEQLARLQRLEANKTALAMVSTQVKAAEAQKLNLASLRTYQSQFAAGSAEQIAAAAAITKAEAVRNRSMGLTTVATARTGAAAQTAERDFGKLTRGALAGSGVFSALGRSLAFASGGFLAVAGGAALISKAIKGALDLASTQRQVEAQLKTSGKTWDQYGTRIDAVDLKLSHISGFTNQDLLQSFGYLVRVSGNVDEALHLNAVAADVARGRHIALSSASLALAKALGGSDTALRRLGVIIPKNLTTMQALAYVQEKFAGQAQAGATEADRFRAALANTGDIIGTALLPTFDRLVTRAGDWLSTASKSGRIQRDANEAVKIAGDVFHTLGAVISGVDRITGSFAHTVEILIGLKVVSSVGTWITSLDALAARWLGVGAAAKSAAASEGLALGGAVGGAAAGEGLTLRAALQQRRLAAAQSAAASRLPTVFGEYTGAAEVAGVGTAAALATSRVALLRASLLRLASRAFVVTLVLEMIPKNKMGQSILDKEGLGFAGRLPVVGGAATQLTNFGAWLGDQAGIETATTDARRAAAARAARYRTTHPLPTWAGWQLTHPTDTYADFQRQVAFEKALYTNTPFTGKLPGAGMTGSDRGPKAIRQWATFTLNSTEQLMQAQAGLTTSTVDDVREAKEIIARIKRVIAHGHLHGSALIQALQEEAAALSTIQSAADATKAKTQAAAATYNIPLNLQVSQARLETYGKDTTSVLKQIIAAATRAIASGKKSGAGLIAAYGVVQTAQQQLDTQLASIPLKLQYELAKEQASGSDQTATLKKVKAALERALKKAKGNYEAQIAVLNQIAGVNQQLGSSAASALGDFRQLNIDKIAKGLHLTVEQAKKLKSQLSQIGPGGTVPGHGTGAYGYAIGPGGGVHHHHHHLEVSLDGRPIESSVRYHRQKRISQNSSQRRGPNAGMAY